LDVLDFDLIVITFYLQMYKTKFSLPRK